MINCKAVAHLPIKQLIYYVHYLTQIPKLHYKSLTSVHLLLYVLLIMIDHEYESKEGMKNVSTIIQILTCPDTFSPTQWGKCGLQDSGFQGPQ